ncbi:MAG: cupin domain-containing protein [Thermoanaerobaculia bacterium]|nr:cupin domain-containing protein [Thermoanaerobaculia bacterium]
MPEYEVIRGATRIQAPGGKLIEELFGRVANGEERFSLAHMVAPGRWTEPPQRPGFGELTLVLKGRLRIDVGGDEVTLGAGEAIWVEPGVRVHYGNPFDEECEYYALCLPAFSPELAGREG